MAKVVRISWFIKPLSIFVAMVMAIWPLPQWLGLWRPDWVVLIVLFWTIHARSMPLWLVWWLGLVVDVQMGTPLGMHSLSMSVTIWGAVQAGSRVRVFTLWQTCGLVALLDMVYRMLDWLVLECTVNTVYGWGYLWPVVTSALVWPVLLMLMRYEGVRL